jgi:ankyrin repeat protein
LIYKDPTSGQPPLVEAAQWGQMKMVELLVTNHADINAHGVWGYTALHFAAHNGDAKSVEFLLKHGADPNARDEQGLTPIIQSIKSVEVIKLLLAYGADINAHGYDNTLYSQAIENPQSVGAGVIDFILTNGVDVTVSGNEGLAQVVLFTDKTNLMRTLMSYYARSTNPAAKPLLQGAMELAIDNDRKAMASTIVDAYVQLQTNSLHKAVALGNDAAVRSILTTNSSAVNEKDFFGWTPLHLAAMTGKSQIAEMLISSNATLDARDDISNTPLLWAAYFGHADMVALLLRHKANMDIQGDTVFNSGNFGGNDTPLDLAIEQGFNSIAAMLITNGANLGSHKFYSDSPLHLATSKENVELMKRLIAYGANVNARSQASWTMPLTCLDIAVRGNSPEAVSLLIASGASIQTQQRTHSWTNTTLFHLWAEGSGNTNIADQLLAAGCDPNAKNGDGKLPCTLQSAATKNLFGC